VGISAGFPMADDSIELTIDLKAKEFYQELGLYIFGKSKRAFNEKMQESMMAISLIIDKAWNPKTTKYACQIDGEFTVKRIKNRRKHRLPQRRKRRLQTN
jgi:hypothetical protein